MRTFFLTFFADKECRAVNNYGFTVRIVSGLKNESLGNPLIIKALHRFPRRERLLDLIFNSSATITNYSHIE